VINLSLSDKVVSVIKLYISDKVVSQWQRCL